MYYKVFFSLLILAICGCANAQVREITLLGITDTKIHQKTVAELADAPSLSAGKRVLQTLTETYAARGFAAFAIDSFVYADTCHWRVVCYEGDVFILDSLRIENFSPAAFREARLPMLLHTPYSQARVEAQLHYATRQFAQRGYPFAAFQAQPPRFRSPAVTDTSATGVTLMYRFSAGQICLIDSIHIQGNHREKDRFVRALMRLQVGDAYNQRLIEEIPRVLENSPYFRKVAKPSVRFTPEGNAHIYIDLERRKSNRFDVLVGLLPASNSSPNASAFQVTANLDVALTSPFRLGEMIQLKFNKLPSASQQINVKYAQPFVLQTPLRLEGEFDSQKQDTSFQTVKFSALGAYVFTSDFQAKVNYRRRTSYLLSTAAYERDTTRTPPVLDATRRIIAVNFDYQKVDYLYNPSKGWYGMIGLGTGSSNVQRNLRLSKNLYRDIAPSQNSREIEAKLGGYLPFGKRGVGVAALQGYRLLQDRILRNDQVQLGGARSLRGFNENAFFADAYARLTLEYRYRLERDSYIVGFCDYAYLEDRATTVGQTAIRRPLGVGLGMNYATKAGIMSILYAIGRDGDIGFQPSRGKVHVGLVQQF